MPRNEKFDVEFSIPQGDIIVKHATCPNGHLLNTGEVKINGHDAIKVQVKVGGKGSGLLYMDPVYGSYNNIEKDISMTEGDIAAFFCPECGVDMKDTFETCHACSAPLFCFHLPKRSIVEGCSRKGCTFHKLKIVDSETQMGRLFDNSTLESFV